MMPPSSESMWRRYRRFWRADVSADVDAELRFHFEQRAAELRDRGVPADAIAAHIIAEFGDVEATRHQLTEIGVRIERHRARSRWWRDLGADLRYVTRSLARHRTFTLTVVATFALGIAATTAMLSVARAAFVGLVPFADADQLVALSDVDQRDAASQDATVRGAASYADIVDWRESGAFAALEGYDETNLTLTGIDDPVRLEGARVTPGFLAMLGARPGVGRTLAPSDDGAAVAVVSHAFSQRWLGGDESAVGRTITLDGRAFTVVGVLPRTFRFVPAGEADVWLPLDRGATQTHDRADRWLRVVARLRPNVSVTQASAVMAALAARLAEQYPGTNERRTVRLTPLRDQIVGPTRPLVLALGGAVTLLLLVACTNAAALFLARSLARSRELAMRIALGAGRDRVVRQLLTESVLLAVVGGAVGVLLAWLGVTALAAAAPSYMVGRLPFLRGLSIDVGVAGSAALVTLASGVAFGVAPALLAVRGAFAGLGRRDVGGAAGGRTRRALVAAQLAFATVLLVASGLMARSVVTLLRVDPGFATTQAVWLRIALSGERYETAAEQQRFFEALVAQAGALPGVRSAGAVSQLPLAGGRSVRFRVVGAPDLGRAARPTAMWRGVAGDYFASLGIRVVAGRALGARDDAGAPKSVVVSDGLARQLFGGATAIGRQLRLDRASDSVWTVVGVVSDVRATSLDAPETPTIYATHLQAPENRMTLVARAACAPSAACDPAALGAALRRVARTLDPELPVAYGGTIAEQVASTPAVYVRRSLLLLFGAFALVATLLAAVGLYGVMAFQVARRTAELAVRTALGATRGDVIALVARQSAALAGAGILTGLVAAAVAARGLAFMLYGVRPADLLTYAAVAVVLTGVTAIANIVPARRAARVSPVDALRAD